MKKLAIIVQRYGKDVLGGAEVLAMNMAKRLKEIYDVTVLTSMAKDFTTWEDELNTGNAKEVIEGVKVLRFHVEKSRDMESEEWIDSTNKVMWKKTTIEFQEEWMRKQGPYTKGLITLTLLLER